MKKYNEQGVRLIDDQILILPDKVEDTYETKSGVKIYKAQDLEGKNQKMEEAAQTKATIVDLSPTAYCDLDDEDKPAIGDRIFIQRHAGEYFEGSDEVGYRIIHEGDVVCFINF